MGDIRTLYSDAAGLWWENRYRAIAESIANITLNIVLGQLFGVHGIIIATLISLFIINYILGSQIVFKYYFKNKKMGEFFRSHFFYFCVTAAIAILTVKLCDLVILGTIPGLVVKIIICLIVPSLLYFIIYRKTDIYKQSMPWLLSKYKLEKKLAFLIKGID